jgi:hypothetical protein
MKKTAFRVAAAVCACAAVAWSAWFLAVHGAAAAGGIAAACFVIGKAARNWTPRT